jgi:DNA-binding NarL/FixJ family response regulator
VARLEEVRPRGVEPLRCGGETWVAALTRGSSAGVTVARDRADDLMARGASFEACLRLHDAARLGAAEAVAGDMASIAATCQGDLASALAAHVTALAARDGDQLLDAATALEGAGTVLWAAEALAAASAAFKRAGRTGSATAAGARAHELAERCEGARPPLLADLDVSGGLTGRELEIARLAATGLGDRQIADALHLSVRTVHSHLHRVYGKLGIHDRTELPSVLGPARPTAPA